MRRLDRVTSRLSSESHVACSSFATVRELYEKVKYGLGVGLFDNKQWKPSIPEKYHAFAGDYHRFEGDHRPYQFYVKTMDTVTPEWFVKMAPPLAKAGENGSREVSNMLVGFRGLKNLI